MRKRQRKVTVLEVATRATGSFKSGAAVLSFFLEWHLVAQELGRTDFSMDEMATTIGKSRAQTFKDQQLFRKVFPAYSTPGDLAAAGGNEAVRDWAAGLVALGHEPSMLDIARGCTLPVAVP